MIIADRINDMKRLYGRMAIRACLLFIGCMLFSAPSFAAMAISEFGHWELAHRNSEFTLSTRPRNSHDARLQLAGSFATPFAKLPETFQISLKLAGEALKDFDEGESERCVIFVDGIKYVTHVKRQRSMIELDVPELGAALLASRHENFVIGFPALAISWTFPVGGLTQAFNRVRVLQEQMGIAERETARKNFGVAGSVGIVCAALLGFCFLVWGLLRKKRLARVENPHAETRAHAQNEKTRPGRARKSGFGNARGQSEKDYRAEAGRAYAYQSRGGSQKAAEDFYERANFGSSFGHSSSLPPDVIAALKFFGLSENATFREAHKKRNFMLKAYHPDRFENDANARAAAEEETKQINYNYDILQKYFGR